MLQQITEEFYKSTKKLALKLLLIKKIIIIPCTSTQRIPENEKRKGYRILISSF